MLLVATLVSFLYCCNILKMFYKFTKTAVVEQQVFCNAYYRHFELVTLIEIGTFCLRKAY